jgi:predicted HAD superfamily Cof-like phosphohydrolase
MSQDWYQDIVNFHKEVCWEEVQVNPHLIDEQLLNLRLSLINEEIGETFLSMGQQSLVGIADGIVDSIVVLIGTAVAYGIDIRPVWDEVHRTNMLKKGGEVREDGKRLKPKEWKPPNIQKILLSQVKEL